MGPSITAYSIGILAMATLCAHAQPAFSNAISLGAVNIAGLTEPSGLAASRNNPGVLWTHNDVGDTPRLFAMATNGSFLGNYNLTNGSHVDYEEIALGPGPVASVQYLYIGDIGDNKSERSSIVIYQIPEPAVYLRQATNPPALPLKGRRAITLRYPDRAQNAETLMVDPLSGDVFIATRTNVSRVYMATKAQLEAGGTVTLSFVRQFPFEIATAGAISPTGGEIVMRQLDVAWLWTRAPGQPVTNALAGPMYPIPVVGRPLEPNGEGISFDPIGRDYFTISDSAPPQQLNYFRRVSPYAFRPPRTLVSAGSMWRYLDTGTNLGAGWRVVGFDDSHWNSGEGQLGYGDADEYTTVNYGSSASSKHITTYFRKTFTATNLANINRLELRLVFDDGAAVFLNGTQIALLNLTNGATFNARATNTQEALEDTWFTIPVDSTLLAETNILAVEVHQASASSDDLSFDAQLIAHELVPPQILSSSRHTNGFAFTFLAATTNATVEFSTNTVSWATIGLAPVTNGIGAYRDVGVSNAVSGFYRVLMP